MPLVMQRLEDDLLQAKSTEEIRKFLRKHPDVADKFFDAPQYPDEDTLAVGLFKTFQNPHIATLYQEVNAAYGDSTLRQDLTNAFRHIAYHYPSFRAPQVKTIISGLYKDIYFSEDVLIIGLDYFIGPSATYKPLDLPRYLLERYTPDYLAPTALLYLSNRYNKIDPKDQTLLADMVAAGKTLYFVQAVFPCLPAERVIGYTRAQWEEVTENEQTIWDRFVRNQWFYETHKVLKQRLMGERPSVPEIGSKCPGRIGRWLGWNIVRSYMESHPQLRLPDLMQETNAVKIFTLSQYKRP